MTIFPRILFVILFSSLSSFPSIAGKFNDKQVQQLKSLVVSLQVSQIESAYMVPGKFEGTGFIIDKKKGLIVTNRHIAHISAPARYEGFLSNGTLIEPVFVWNDPTNDFAILKVDPAKLPKDLPEIAFSEEIGMNDPVCIIGNNQCNSHSIQTGVVIDLYPIEDICWPQRAFHISLNTRGGSSGSPVFNRKGEIVAINYAGSETTAYALPIGYVLKAIKHIEKEQMPPRYFSGALFSHLFLDRAKDYYKFPAKTALEDYINKHQKEFSNRLLIVESILVGTPAENVLQVGDIVAEVNGKIVGPDLLALENIFNASEGKPVAVSVYRNGKSLKLQVPVMSLNEMQCQKMIKFGNTVFASVDPHMSHRTNMKLGGVCIASNSQGSFLDLPIMPSPASEPQVMLTEMNGVKISCLDDLVGVLPRVAKDKKFNFKIKNYGLHIKDGGSVFHTNQSEGSLFGRYEAHFYPPPVIIEFDLKTKGWVRQDILESLEAKQPALAKGD